MNLTKKAFIPRQPIVEMEMAETRDVLSVLLVLRSSVSPLLRRVISLMVLSAHRVWQRAGSENCLNS